MEWLGDLFGGIAGTLLSAGSGGLLGVFGGIFSAFLKMREERERRAWQLQVWEREERLQRLQMEARAAETEQEIALAGVEGSWKGLADSYEHDISSGQPYKWVASALRLFRPVLTTGLLVVYWLVWRDLWSALAAGESTMLVLFTEVEVRELLRYMVSSTVFMASTAALWWFAERAFMPPGMKR